MHFWQEYKRSDGVSFSADTWCLSVPFLVVMILSAWLGVSARFLHWEVTIFPFKYLLERYFECRQISASQTLHLLAGGSSELAWNITSGFAKWHFALFIISFMFIAVGKRRGSWDWADGPAKKETGKKPLDLATTGGYWCPWECFRGAWLEYVQEQIGGKKLEKEFKELFQWVFYKE